MSSTDGVKELFRRRMVLGNIGHKNVGDPYENPIRKRCEETARYTLDLVELHA
jgi:hypothetical protein